MTHGAPPDDAKLQAELLGLLADYCDGRLEADGLARLSDLLHSHAWARLLYADYLDLHVTLRTLANREQSVFAVPSMMEAVAIADEPAESTEPSPAVIPLASPPVRSESARPVQGFLAAVSNRVPGGEWVLGSLVVSVVVAAFMGLASAYYGKLRKDAPAARIVASENARWTNQPSAVSNHKSEIGSQQSEISNHKSEIPPGTPLTLASGTVELNLNQGATLVIEGPAKWIIDGDNRATLEYGTLQATVPDAAKGFTLETPTAKIVDLGTEFHVVVDRQGATETRVLRGLVEVERHGGESDAWFAASTPRFRLTAGQAIQIDHRGTAGPIQVASAGASRLGATLDEPFPALPQRGQPLPAQAIRTPQDADPAILRPLSQPIELHLANGDFDATPLPDGTGSRTIPGWFESATTNDLGNDLILRNARRFPTNATNLFGTSKSPGYIYQQIGTYLPGTRLALRGDVYWLADSRAELTVALYVGNVSGASEHSLASLRAVVIGTARLSPNMLGWGIGGRPVPLAVDFELDDPALNQVPLWLEVARMGDSGNPVYLDNLTLTATRPSNL